VHVSTHVSLRQACDAVTRDRVLKVIELGARRLQPARHRSAREVGVAGLNPHASDGGLFGFRRARAHHPRDRSRARPKGIAVEGPVPADTFFAKATGGAYDICVAMYHDQGPHPR
jgi:4-hydroxythreonine-4-phosphate dehydrogenase